MTYVMQNTPQYPVHYSSIDSRMMYYSVRHEEKNNNLENTLYQSRIE